jgi:hypothetical protein
MNLKGGMCVLTQRRYKTLGFDSQSISSADVSDVVSDWSEVEDNSKNDNDTDSDNNDNMSNSVYSKQNDNINSSLNNTNNTNSANNNNNNNNDDDDDDDDDNSNKDDSHQHNPKNELSRENNQNASKNDNSENNKNNSHEERDEDVDNEDSGEEVYDSIPTVVNLFISHPNINLAIDAIESVMLENEGPWNIEKALNVFVTFAYEKNIQNRTTLKSTLIHSHEENDEECEILDSDTNVIERRTTQTLSKSKIRHFVDHLYQQNFVPFLAKVGIQTSSETHYVWKWNPTFSLNFVDQVYISSFRTLTREGTVAYSQTFLYLFPKLFLLFDSRAETSLSRVYTNLHTSLLTKGHNELI